MKKIRIGTRGSKLALAQTKIVENALIKQYPELQSEIVIINTKGDKILDKPIYAIGDKGLFINEFEDAIINNKIDVAIHSAKDLPSKLKDGLEIICTPKRADARDILVLRKNLKNVAVIGTSSPRREFYVKQNFPNVEVKTIKGNVDTRLNKLASGEYDGIILAKAGLDRLNYSQKELLMFDIKILDTKSFIPAACQGIIAIEAKKDFKYIIEFQQICDRQTFLQYKIEREVLRHLQANCSEVNAVYSNFSDDNNIEIEIMYKGCKIRTSGEYSRIFEKIPEMVSEIKQ